MDSVLHLVVLSRHRRLFAIPESCSRVLVGGQNGDVKTMVGDEALRSVTRMDLNTTNCRRVPVNELK